jgi:GTP-binding protein
MKRSMIVSIIGRPNVGKSSIFNRILRQGEAALTHNLPGVTRDRHYAIATMDSLSRHEPRDIILIDTGGFYPEKYDVDEKTKRKHNYEPFFNLMADHAKMAIEESDLVLFVLDIREGLIPFDKMIRDVIRQHKKKFWAVINKCDTEKQDLDVADFYALDIDSDDMLVVSAEHARGMENLRERLHQAAIDFDNLKTESDIQKGVTPNHEVVASVAIIGAPNVGKSTLLNRLVGATRSLVSDIAGTTVDPINGYFDLDFKEQVSKLKAINDPMSGNLKLLNEYKEYMLEQTELDSDLVVGNKDEDDLDLFEDMMMLHKFEHDSEEFEDFNEIEDEAFELSEELVEEDLITEDENNTMLFSDTETSEVEEDGLVEESAEIIDENTFRTIRIVDTAGIRKSKQVKGFVESHSVYRSLRAISESDIVFYMVDATAGIGHNDRRLIDISLEKGKSVIVCLNKMDLMLSKLNGDRARREWIKDLRATVPWLNYCELITISAKTGRHLWQLKESLKKTILIRHEKIATAKLNQCLNALIEKNPVTLQRSGGVRFKVKYASMLKASPPTILLFTNRSKGIPENYRRYLTNGIRNNFGIYNTPVHLIFRTRSELERRIKKVNVTT